MTEKKLKSFELLKQQVEATFREQVTSCQESIHDWKGKQITLFQESLSEQVGGYVSENGFIPILKLKKMKNFLGLTCLIYWLVMLEPKIGKLF